MNRTRKIQIRNTTYLVESVFAKSGSTVAECIEAMVKRKLDTKTNYVNFKMNGVDKMKKIPTLFERVFENHMKVGILPHVTPGMEWVLEGKGVATVKYDGSCCAIINGNLYKRYDAKHGKKAPDGAIPCCEPDSATGHHPHWLKVDENNPADRWFIAAYNATPKTEIHEGTYEAIGLHFNSNKYNLNKDILVRHGEDIVEVERSFEGIKKYLEEHNIEGLVFWYKGEPACKIKRSDFGFSWPME